MPQLSVYEWTENFKNGRTSFTHEEGAGRLSTATTDGNIERVRDMVLLDRRLTTDEVAIIRKLVMVLRMKSSTIGLVFIKFVQDGSQNNSQCCINKRALSPSTTKATVVAIV